MLMVSIILFVAFINTHHLEVADVASLCFSIQIRSLLQHHLRQSFLTDEWLYLKKLLQPTVKVHPAVPTRHSVELVSLGAWGIRPSSWNCRGSSNNQM